MSQTADQEATRNDLRSGTVNITQTPGSSSKNFNFQNCQDEIILHNKSRDSNAHARLRFLSISLGVCCNVFLSTTEKDGPPDLS